MGIPGGIPTYVGIPPLGYVMAQMVVNCIVVLAMLVAVGLRIMVRFTGAGLGLDDLFICLSAPLGTAMLICQGFFLHLGAGYSIAKYPQLSNNFHRIFFVSFFMQIIYVVCLATAKASMLLFYRRVFSTRNMRVLVNVTLALLAAWAVSFVLCCIFICVPVWGFWRGEGKCISYVPMIQSLISTNAIADAIIIILPMRTIWSLQMRTTEKMALMACFGLGSACFIIAIFRVISVEKTNIAQDITGTMAPTVFLFVLEPNLAILCVSIPMLRPLYTRYRSRHASSRLYDNSGSKQQAVHGGNSGDDTIRTIGQQSIAGRRKHRKRADESILEVTQWEMDDYERCSTGATKGALCNMAMTDGVALDEQDTSSQKSLTSKPGRPSVGMEVSSKWAVTRV